MNARTCETTNDLIRKVELSLESHSYHQLNDVTCTAQAADQITLRGQLRSYYLKQIAQTIAQKVPGVRLVRNEILVRP